MRFAWLGVVLVLACTLPDSVELGAACTDQRECKDPSDTCLVFGAKKLCSMKCSADNKCPNNYTCAVLDTTVNADGNKTAAGREGYCLPSADVPPRAVTAY